MLALVLLLSSVGLYASDNKADEEGLLGVYYGGGDGFPTRLVLKEGHQFEWGAYGFGSYQAKGTWLLSNGKLTLQAISNGALNIEKSPPGLQDDMKFYNQVNVCIRYPDYMEKGTGPGGVEIALEDARKRPIVDSKIKAASHYACIAFDFEDKTPESVKEKTPIGEEILNSDVLDRWRYVALRPFGESAWQRFSINQTEKRYRQVGFLMQDSGPPPFDKVELSYSEDGFRLSFLGRELKYRKVDDANVEPVVPGRYENNWGYIDLIENGEYAWYWKGGCCTKEQLFKGHWAQRNGLLFLRGEGNYFQGKYYFGDLSSVVNVDSDVREYSSESKKNGMYAVFVGNLKKNIPWRDGFYSRFSSARKYEVEIFDKNNKSIGVAVTAGSGEAMVVRDGSKKIWSKLAIRPFGKGASWFVMNIPKGLQQETSLVLHLDEDVQAPAPFFDYVVAEYSHERGVVVRGPIYFTNIVAFEKAK